MAVVATVIFCVSVVAVGYVSYSRYEGSERRKAEALLMAVAADKIDDLLDWRADRLHEAQALVEEGNLVSMLDRHPRLGGDPAAERALLNTMDHVRAMGGYLRISVAGPDGRPLLGSPALPGNADERMAADIAATLATGRARFLDARPDPDTGGQSHWSLAVPVLATTDRTAERPAGRPLGAVVLCIDPATSLLPSLTRWPVPSETGETLLVWRDGDDAVYLNSPRVRPGEPFTVRVPLQRSDVRTVRAVQGERGIVESEDLDGTPVMAALLPVPDSPWFLVTSMETSELLGPLRARAWSSLLAMMAVLMIGVAGLGVVWRWTARDAAAVEREQLDALTAMTQVVEASPIVAFRWGASEGWPVEWVSSNVSLWGYSAEALMRNDPPFSELIHPDDRAAVIEEVKRHTAEGPDSFRHEYRVVAADGVVMHIVDRTTIVRDADGHVARYQGILLDATKRKQLEAQFIQAQKMETIAQLAGGVAHDFNNLLTVINGYAEFAMAEVEADAPVREMLQEIHDAGTRASVLTRQLLAFSHRQPVLPLVLDLNSVAERMRKMAGRLIGEDLQLTFDLDEALWPVRADEGQIEQVIMNLVVNARDAMPEGGLLMVSTRNVTLGDGERGTMSVPAGDYARLSVSDTGCGMDEATRQHLFEPYFTTKAVGHGTGLGLSTVLGIITKAGGGIRVSSAPGQGTTVEVYLPRAENDEGKPDVVTAQPELAARRNETVLLVEDEDAPRGMAQRTLQGAGYTVLSAANGRAALDILSMHPEVKLVLTDVIMPGMNGHELAAEIRRRRPALKIVFVSGFAPEALPARAPGVEPYHFKAKPYSSASLMTTVREVLDRPPA